MPLEIMSAKKRLEQHRGVKMVIFGPYGIGKTSLLKTLELPTLCLDLEAGLLSVRDWEGDVISIRTWEEARDIACLIGGINPSVKSDQIYGPKHFESVCTKYDLTDSLDHYKTIFIDSITVATRLCLAWAKTQPEIYKNGRIDLRGAYGLLAQEMMQWLNQFQFILDKNIIFVGLLEQKLDEFNRALWTPQCEGSKTSAELPGILDQVISMVGIKQKDGTEERSFVCHTLNPWGYPAKDRSGKLDQIEPPHLGNLLKKITNIHSQKGEH